MDKTLTTQDECTNIIVKFKDQALQSTPLVLKEENTLTQGHVGFFSDFSGLEFNRLIFTVSPEDMIQDMKTYNLPEDLGLFHYYSVQISKDQGNPQSIVDRLKQSPLVETAYIELPYVEFDKPDLVATLEDLTDGDVYAQPDRNPLFKKQGYLYPAPAGIDAPYAWGIPGGNGEGILHVDMQLNGWLLDHEDLVEQKIGLVAGSDNGIETAHGTACLGEVVGADNEIGVIGISPKAQAKVTSFYRNNGKPSPVDAIVTAVHEMSPGDVLVMTLGPGSLPPDYDESVFNAIKYATNKGITVVEAAGNVFKDLDELTRDGKYIFNRNSPDFKDSGAIMVGAGSSSVPHNRLGFSNYGSRVDVYAWGEHITTTDSDKKDPSKKNLYTDFFGGTSGAAPIIAGVVVNLQGIAKANLGKPFTPKEIRDLLSDPGTGTPTKDPTYDKIGVMPDLKAILNKLGFYSKILTPPKDLRATKIKDDNVALQWSPSESNIGIEKYLVYRNDALVAQVISTQCIDKDLEANTEYGYTVKAVDRNGNASYASNEIKVKTKHINLEGNQFAWSMKGIGDHEFAKIDFNKNKEEMQIQLKTGIPHPNFNEIYVSIKVIDSSGEVMYEKDIYGNKQLNNETKHLSVKVGDSIVLKHKEGKSRGTLINVDNSKRENFGTWMAYGVTKNGLKLILNLEATDIQSKKVVLQWSNPYENSDDLWYYVYRDDYDGFIGGSFGGTNHTDNYNLKANTEYRYRVEAEKNGNVLGISNTIKVKTKSDGEDFNEVQIVTALNDTSVVDLNRSSSEVTLWSNHGGDNQKWKLVYDRDKNAYQIKSVSDKNLVLAWNAIPNSKQVFATPNQYKEEHYWILEDTRDGYYIIKNKKDQTLVLDVADSKTENGSKIIVYKQNNGKNQKFKLRKV
ncbi:RICIN domain-containing protein [Paenibacillus larvae]|nr:putative mucin/carbohydrate-binding domain-containing protein [Paenibacillus larvae]MCY9523817.1 RICIN domain-containing protein [Paenibacillus larvae]